MAPLARELSLHMLAYGLWHAIITTYNHVMPLVPIPWGWELDLLMLLAH
jgi:hypothetical protein